MPQPPRHQHGGRGRGAGARRAPTGQTGGRQTPTVRRPQAYFTDGGVPRHELFDVEAQAEAKLWADNDIKPAQVRRFYGQIQADRRRIELEGAKAQDEEARVAMALLKAATAYAAARESKREPLHEFAKWHARLVNTIADFKMFCRHFEAVVAWHRVYKPR